MIRRLIWNDMRRNKLLTAVTIFFMAACAALVALATLLFADLWGSVGALMDRAQVPDLLQMHAGPVDERRIAAFAFQHPEVASWQVCRFLNLDNGDVMLGDRSLLDSTQDNGLSVQSPRFDFLLDMDGEHVEPSCGEVYVPVCYRDRYGLEAGDTMRVGTDELAIAGFLRDAQMSSMMASSKRFLVSAEDYARLKPLGEEEHLIEFLLEDGADVDALADAYAEAGLPANGPAITKALIRMTNSLSDGTTIMVLALVAVVVVLVSLLCGRFILSIRLERNTREIGMLKALGLENRAIRRLYFVKYVLFAALGTLAGLLAAELLKAPLQKEVRALYGAPPPGGAPDALALLAALSVEPLILLSVWRSLMRMDRLAPLEALFPVRNHRQDRRQSVLIGTVAAACAFLMLLPQNLYFTVSSPSFATYMGIGEADIRIDVRQGADLGAQTARMEQTLDRDPAVLRHVSLQTRSIPATLEDGTRTTLAVESGDHSVFPVRYAEGRLPEKEGEIALSTLNAEALGLSVRDSLTLRVDEEEMPFTVCGVYADVTNGGRTAKTIPLDTVRPVIWSVLYVSLEDPAHADAWVSAHSGSGAHMTELGSYVRETYGPTLDQLRLACASAALVAVIVGFVVVALFVRLGVERDRDGISLRKALGLTTGDVQRAFFQRGMLAAAAGLVVGLVPGMCLAEWICGTALRAFGAAGFRFEIPWHWMLAWIPAILLGTTLLAVLAGVAGIRHVRASECCAGRE